MTPPETAAMRVFILASLSLTLVFVSPHDVFAASPAPSPTAAPASAASMPPAIALAQSRVDAMLRTGHADPDWFSASFLAQIPASYVDQVVAGLIKTLGAYQSVQYTPEKFIAHFAKGTDDVLIHLDAENKIDGLLFRPPVTSTSSLDNALQLFARMPGAVSYVIEVEGRPEKAALNASEPLAIGSAFKLAVLSALRDEVTRGMRQ